jgi:hypothetical protein
MSSYPNRPTKREIYKRLNEAKAILESKEGFFANPAKVVGELDKLRLPDSSGVWPLILDLLNEIKIEDYSGAHPPLPSTEPEIEGRDLYAFTWDSNLLDKKMYLKFAIKENDFYYVSLHVSRPKKRS